MPRRMTVAKSDFYCVNCGKRTMTIPRPKSLIRPAFHRKKLYCPWCKETYNCVECRNDAEAYEFRLDFEDGLYKEEAVPYVE